MTKPKEKDNDHKEDNDDKEDDDREEENATLIWMISIGVAAIAMALAGRRWWAGMLATMLGLYWGIGGSLMKPLSIAEKKTIEYNIWSAEDCYVEVKNNNKKVNDVCKLALLAALSKKYNRILVSSGISNSTTSSRQDDSKLLLARRQEVALICHNAAHEIIEGNGQQQDLVLDAAMALLALVATEPMVRLSYYDKDSHRLESVLEVLQQARLRAKHYRNPDQEQRAAELQRKGCLLLGALANRTITNNATAASNAVQDNIFLGRRIVAKGGMQCIIEALAWFRFHEHVANWALWAIFTLLYDQEEESSSSSSSSLSSPATNTAIQQLLNANGGPVILTALENCGHNPEVARHGIAIVYHLVVAKNISLPPAPVIRIVEQLLSQHSAASAHDVSPNFIISTNKNPDEISESARQQIAVMGCDILVRMGRIPAKTTAATRNDQ